ncbi:MAG: GNAT family N-acetyltransferase [Clostridia bacterium]|nr:GNAT family N-acetyltransferase [Clostridia bacterium]
MEIKEISISDFKENIYKRYVKIFPLNERKTLCDLKVGIQKDVIKFFEIIYSTEIVGFFIINDIKDLKFIQIDYFAIFPEYQSRGYGKMAINALKEKYFGYKNIYLEAEKIGLGKNDSENQIRIKRSRFYEELGFRKLNFDISLWKVIYSVYMLECAENVNDLEVKNNVLKLYYTFYSKDVVEKRCFII